MQDRVFYSICFGFIFGVLLASFLVLNLYFIFLLGLLSGSLLLFCIFIFRNNLGVILACFILCFSFGMFRFHIDEHNFSDILEPSVGSRVSLTGQIVDEPSVGENTEKVIVKIKDENIKVLITTPINSFYKYGDEVSLEGKLQKPENFITDQGKTFDYINYLRKDGVLYIMSYPRLEVLSHNNGNFIKSYLFTVKNIFLEKINRVIPSPESLLLGGIILGEKSAFSTELRQSFVNTGTIHIVALSGYNITIVAEWIMKIFSFLPHLLGTWVGVLSIILFILMTGSSSTAMRAGVMAVMALYARQSGRNYDVGRALAFTALVMILFNPFILAFDVSFQLSFIATIALIFFTPRIEKYFYWVPETLGLRDIASVTVAVYIFVLPFILYKMGNLSLVALPANFLVLPFIPLTMLLGFLTGFVGLFSYFLSIPFAYVSQYLLQYELSIVSFFSHIPFSAITIPNFPLFLTVLIYLYFIYFLFWRSFKELF